MVRYSHPSLSKTVTRIMATTCLKEALSNVSMLKSAYTLEAIATVLLLEHG